MTRLQDTRIKQKEFAALLGVSQALISSLVKDGTLRREGTLGEWVRAFITREVDMAGGSAGSDEWQRERTQLMKLRRQIAELDYEKAAGRLSPTAEMREVLEDIVVTSRVSFSDIPGVVVSRVTHLVNGLPAQNELYDILDEEIRTALTNLAAMAKDASAVEPDEPEEDETE